MILLSCSRTVVLSVAILATCCSAHFVFADSNFSFATDACINHDDLIDIDVHAIAMRTMVDRGFVHVAEPRTSICSDVSWMCQDVGISEALITTIVLGSLLSAPRPSLNRCALQPSSRNG